MRTVTWAHVIPGMYAPNGTMQYAGGAYNWLKNTVCSMESYKAKEEGTSPYIYMNEQIEKSTVGANGLIFLPYLLGERAPAGTRTRKALGSASSRKLPGVIC